MIYPVVKKQSEVVNHYVLPAAVGAGLGVGSRVFIQNHNANKDKFDKDSKNLGLAGAAIGGAGAGIYASGAIRGDRSDKNLGKVIGLPGIFAMHESNRRLKEDVKKQSDALKKNPITNVLNNGLGKLLKNKENYHTYDFGLEKGFKEAVKKVTKKQSLTDALLLPSVGAAVGAGKGLYDNKIGALRNKSDYAKRMNLIGNTLAGTGAGMAISDTNMIARGSGLVTGISGLELARRARFSPGKTSSDGAATIAAINGSGL